MRAFLLCLALAGCAPAGELESHREADLQRELAGLRAGAPVDCISTLSSVSLDIASEEVLVYRANGVTWVNRLPSRCPGLRPLNQLVVEPTSGGRYCRGDRVRGIEPGSSIPGPICPLGSFTPYRRP